MRNEMWGVIGTIWRRTRLHHGREISTAIPSFTSSPFMTVVAMVVTKHKEKVCGEES